MSRSCYSALENGAKIPDFITVYTLSEFYGVNLDYLLAFDISEHLLSLLRADRRSLDSFSFLDGYMKLPTEPGCRYATELMLFSGRKEVLTISHGITRNNPYFTAQRICYIRSVINEIKT